MLQLVLAMIMTDDDCSTVMIIVVVVSDIIEDDRLCAKLHTQSYVIHLLQTLNWQLADVFRASSSSAVTRNIAGVPTENRIS